MNLETLGAGGKGADSAVEGEVVPEHASSYDVTFASSVTGRCGPMINSGV
jgi:hypothetical protein